MTITYASNMPSADLPTTADTYILNTIPTANFGGSSDIRCDNWGGELNFSLYQYNHTLIPPGADIYAAYHNLFEHSVPVAGHITGLYLVTSPWNEFAVTWNTIPTFTTPMIQTGVLGIINGAWRSFDATPHFTGWYKSTFPNYGVLLKQDSPVYQSGSASRSKESFLEVPNMRVYYNIQPRITITNTKIRTDASYIVDIRYKGTDADIHSCRYVSNNCQYSTNGITWSVMKRNDSGERLFTAVGAALNFEWDVSSIILSVGNKPLKVRLMANDGFTNSNFAYYSNILLDAFPPSQPNLITPADNIIISSNKMLFTWTSCTDYFMGINNYSLSITNPGLTWKNSVPVAITNYFYTGIPEGTNIWRVFSRDNAGNTTSSITRRIRVDTLPPVPVFIQPGPYITNIAPMDFIWGKGIDTVSGFSNSMIFYLTNTLTAWKTNTTITTTNITILNKGLGPYKWRLTLFDHMGNFTNTALRNMAIDTNKPTRVSLISPPNDKATNRSACRFVWTSSSDLVSGISNYYLFLTNTTTAKKTNVIITQTNINLTNLSDGWYFWKVRARDRAGLYAPFSSTNRLSIDANPPVITMLSPASNSIEVHLKVAFQWNVFDISLSNVRVEIDTNHNPGDGYEIIKYHNSPCTNIFGHNGTNSYRIWAIDRSKNTTYTSNRPFIIYTNKPIPVSHHPINIYTNNGDVRFLWSDVSKMGVGSNILQVSAYSNFAILSRQMRSNGKFTNYKFTPAMADNKWFWRILTYQTNDKKWYISPVYSFIVDSTPPAVTSSLFPALVNGENNVILRILASDAGRGNSIITNAGYSLTSWANATNNPLNRTAYAVTAWWTNFWPGTNFLSYAQGNYTVYFRAKDKIGFWSPLGTGINSNSFTVDKIAFFKINHTPNVGRGSENQVVITAYDWRTNIITDYAGTINVDTTGNASTITWKNFSGQGVLTPVSGDLANYKFSAADNGVVTLLIKDTISEVFNISARVLNSDGWHTDDGSHGAMNVFNAPLVEYYDRDYNFKDFTYKTNVKVSITDPGDFTYYILNETQITPPATNAPEWKLMPPGAGWTNYSITNNPGTDGLKKFNFWCMKGINKFILGPMVKYMYLDTTGPSNMITPPQIIPTALNGQIKITMPPIPNDAGVGTKYWRLKRINDNAIIGGTNLLNNTILFDNGLIDNKSYRYRVQFMDSFYQTNTFSSIGSNWTLPVPPNITSVLPIGSFFTNQLFSFVNNIGNFTTNGIYTYHCAWNFQENYTISTSDSKWKPVMAPQTNTINRSNREGYWYFHAKSYNPSKYSAPHLQITHGPFKSYIKVPGKIVLTSTKYNVRSDAVDLVEIACASISNIQPARGFVDPGELFSINVQIIGNAGAGNKVFIDGAVKMPDGTYQISGGTNGSFKFQVRSTEPRRMNIIVYSSVKDPVGSRSSIEVKFFKDVDMDPILMNTMIKPEQGDKLSIAISDIEKVKLKWVKIYDIRGKLVWEQDQKQVYNQTMIEWDCRRFQKYVQSGLYFVVIECNQGRKVFKAVIVK